MTRMRMTMFPEDLIRSITVKTPSKILLVVIDGLGGLPVDGRTELEVSRIPNLDRLASQSICGLVDPIAPGITPGSGPSHLAIFGYDPVRHQIGRGVLEAVGVGLQLEKGDLAARGNFATVDRKGIVADRRAGRISTEMNQKLCERLQDKIETIEGARVIVRSGREHRFVVVFRGEALDSGLTDADPQKDGKKAKPAVALRQKASRSADIVNGFIEQAAGALRDESPANMVLLRGFSQLPDIPTVKDLFKVRAGAIASYPMYRGLARLVGMEVLETGKTVEEEIETVKSHYSDFEFIFLHLKEPDMFGEDGDFKGKVASIEKIDSLLPELLKLKPAVIAITGDHSTPSILRSHSWHPNPILINSQYVRTDSVGRFTERECALGGLGRIRAVSVMPLLLANALKMRKFGA
jgi:2,3-bisphosphoglycerate-independent phosphoglycerate mutase